AEVQRLLSTSGLRIRAAEWCQCKRSSEDRRASHDDVIVLMPDAINRLRGLRRFNGMGTRRTEGLTLEVLRKGGWTLVGGIGPERCFAEQHFGVGAPELHLGNVGDV